jgi:NAD(P)-dependent dehydrogenase (short-subunit alcohol dehydrogenase family)
MADRLHDKVAIITGAATGIGRAAAQLFAAEGARVVVADRNGPAAEQTVASIGESGGNAIFVPVDVSKEVQVKAMVDTAVAEFGKVDVLVNDAGVLIRTPPLHEVSALDWDLSLDTNLRGVFLCCKYTIPHMMESGGSIVNVSSTSGIRASLNSLPYGVSKAGVIQLTQTASRQYAEQRIRVNAIIPGLVDSPQSRGSTGSTETFDQRVSEVPIGRAGEPQDVAYLMLYLASDESTYVTGSSFVIDGGRTAG